MKNHYQLSNNDVAERKHPKQPGWKVQHIEKSITNFSCGMRWSTARDSLIKIKQKVSDEKPLIWTVTGGDEYRSYLKPILQQWLSIGLSPIFLIALDQETATYACSLGYQTSIWDFQEKSYSRVTDAKFEAAATFSELGLPAFFMEVDVFCNKNPLPLFLYSTNNVEDVDYGIVVSGHGYADFVPNIGQYYVRPSLKTTNFFRSVLKLLEYSTNHKEYVTQSGKRRDFFDQRLFYHCLPPTYSGDKDYRSNQAMYLTSDELHENNLLLICRNVTNSQPFHWRPVSNIYISANHPPVIFDSTVCIHPLIDSPFSSLRLKLTTARFLGFDPIPILQKDRFLKTLSGDLTFNECWVFPFLAETFSRDRYIHEKVKYAIATLVYFAKVSNRTLLLPRFLRDRNVFATMILSLVDIRSIEAHVPIKFSLSTDNHQKIIIADGNQKNFTHGLKGVRDVKIVAIEYFCRFVGVEPIKQIREIAESLVFCMEDSRVKFSKGSGSWSRLCGS